MVILFNVCVFFSRQRTGGGEDWWIAHVGIDIHDLEHYMVVVIIV